MPIGLRRRAPALCRRMWAVCSRPRCGTALGSGGAVSIARGTRVSGVHQSPCCIAGLGLLPLEQRALPFAMISVVARDSSPCVTDFGPDTSAPKAVRGQRRLSTLAEALPLAREIGAGSRAPREIDAGSHAQRYRAVEGVSANARPAFNGTLRQGASRRDRKPRS